MNPLFNALFSPLNRTKTFVAICMLVFSYFFVEYAPIPIIKGVVGLLMVTMLIEACHAIYGSRPNRMIDVRAWGVCLIMILVPSVFVYASFHLLNTTALERQGAIIISVIWFAVVGALGRQVFVNTHGRQECWHVFITAWIALPILFMVTILDVEQARGWVWFLLAANFGGDMGGSIFGKTLGDFFPWKLFPDTSPNKTVAGLVGANIFAIVLFWAVWGWKQLPIHFPDAILLAFVLCNAGVLGDWIESRVKRVIGTKDMDTLISIKGHGGLPDRFDSLLVSGPVLAGYLIWCT